jgi:hypothetical protein
MLTASNILHFGVLSVPLASDEKCRAWQRAHHIMRTTRARQQFHVVAKERSEGKSRPQSCSVTTNPRCATIKYLDDIGDNDVQKRSLLLLAALVVLATTQSAAQTTKIRVSLRVTDSSAVLESLFRSALRALPDVEIGDPSASVDYRLTVVSLCDPENCTGRRIGFSGSISLSEPLHEQQIWRAARAADLTINSSVATKMLKPLSQFEVTDQTWTFRWGASVYADAVRKFVAQLDTKCFERSRMYDRAFATPDSAAEKKIEHAIEAREWVC